MLTLGGATILFLTLGAWAAGILGVHQTITRIVVAVGVASLLAGAVWSVIDPAPTTSSDPNSLTYLR